MTADRGAHPQRSLLTRHGAHSHGPHHVVQGVFMALVVSTFFLTFIAQPFRIPSESMQPTLMVGDFVMVDKQAFDRPFAGFGSSHLQRGDLLVFYHPHRAETHVVKRVIGLPGDRLRLVDGHVLVNGHALAEPYARYTAAPSDIFRDDFPSLHTSDPEIEPEWWTEMRANTHDGELTVPAGRYFVLGDNRNDSLDSRYWGFVPRADIEGRAALVYFSVATTAQRSPAESVWARLRDGLRAMHVPR